MEKGLSLSIIDNIYQWAEKTPDWIAVRCGELTISYRELISRAEQLAISARALGDSCPFIGLSATKTPNTIVGMVGIIQSGKAYLPLDREYPAERIAQMVEDAGIKYIVCDSSESEFFTQFGLRALLVPDHSTDESATDLIQPGPGELVTLLYTSGSTGIPKGVCMTHAGMFNLVSHQLQHSKATAASNNLLFSHLSFDASFQEVFVSLASGGTLHIIDETIRLDAARLLHYIGAHKVNRIFIPYVVLQYLTEAARHLNYYPESLVEITTGGELLKITPAIRDFFIHKPDCTLVNVYGPTETSIWVTDLRLSGDASLWPDIPTIGAPITNVDLFLLNSEMKKVTAGDIGEIYIGGVNVSKGYLNRDELTREHYLRWEDENGQPHRIYRTGDLGRVLPNGQIEFHGRADHQVKIRGNRVELGEIEVCLSGISYIAQNVVVLREDISGIKRLVAYLIAEDGKPRDTSPVREHLTLHLPDYMIPSAFVWLDKFPKTTSGKIDRLALPTPEIIRPDVGVPYRRPRSESEHKIVELWSELLLINRIGIDDNFFELGGNSLLAQQTIAEFRQRYGVEIVVTQIYQYPTAAQLASIIDNAGTLQSELQTTGSKRITPGSRAVAIIGMAGRFPGADSIDELWDMLQSGKEAVSFFTDDELDHSIPDHERNDPNYVKARGIIAQADQFDASVFGINPTLAKLMDPQQRVFLEICRDVLESSGYLVSKKSRRIGVFAGSGNNTYFQNSLQHHPEEIAKIGAFQVMLANEKDYIATRTAYHLDLKGPAVSLNTACSTSLVAIAQAVESIRNGQCDMAIAGGVSITVPIISGQRYEEGAMFSADGHTRPFDAEATGTVFSDGAGVVLLKDLHEAEAAGDTIYAVIHGIGLSNDGGGKGSFMAPSADGQAEAIRMALHDADFSPETIGYIEAHGTATPLGDPIEIEGLKLAFGNHIAARQYCRVGSIKSNIGHLTHAAGVAGIIKAALSLHHGIIPPSIHYRKANPNIDFSDTPFVVNDTAYAWKPRDSFRIGVSSFGVGGTNAHVLLENYNSLEEKELHATQTHRPVIIPWSAKTETAGHQYAERLGAFLQKNTTLSLPSLSYTLQTTRHQFIHRYAIVADNHQQLLDKLAAQEWQKYTLDEKASHLAFLFPGQGAQYANMGSDLYHKEPAYRVAVDRCAEILQTEMGEDIRRIIFAPDDGHETLRDTYYTQPAIFVTSYALASLYKSWGIKPDVFVGHSIGEFVAAHLAGIFSLEEALRLIAVRGRLCQSILPGGMLSVRASASHLAPLLSDGLSIAAINAPKLCVVAGPQEELDAFSDLLEAKEIPCKLLRTSHAFHSSMMDTIRESFLTEVGKVALHAPEIPIVSTVTGRWLAAEEATDPQYWANHLVATVRFSEAIVFLQNEWAPIYLEAGPGRVLTTLIKQHGVEFSGHAFASLYPAKEEEHTTLFQTLGNLWLRGVEPQWEKTHLRRPRIIQDIPTYAYDRKKFWINSPGIKVQTEGKYKQTVNITMRKDLLISKIKKLLEDASGVDIAEAPLHASFIEIGFDSLLLTQVAQSLSRAFGITITFRMLNEDYHNLDRLGDYLDKLLPADVFQPAPEAAETSSMGSPVSMPLTPALPQFPPQAVNTSSLDTITLISQQISLISQQIALLQGTAVAAPSPQPQPQPVVQNRTAPQPALVRPRQAAAPTPAQAPPSSPDFQLAPEELAELKKPFGATARIEKHGSSLNENQTRYLTDFVARYVAKTSKSKTYTQEHRPYMADPRVVSGFKPLTKEMTYSIVTNQSKGCRLWDLDGNEYIDALNGFGSNMLGYQPEVITAALHQQIDEGYEIGPQHEKAGDVCRLICELTRTERAALCNTGSEAVLGAMRIARTVTGRSTIVAFSNSYHGIVDEVIVRGTKKLKTFPAAPGIMPESVQNMLILDYGTPESLQIIRERASELAAVLVEPVQSRRPEFQPVDFIRELRKITTESGTALIFDEVITGFRMHLHGIQHLWGIQADLATYGKVVGSGISIGVIAGKRTFMDALDGGYWEYGDDSVPEVGVTYFAGTFVRHPLALAATRATLEYLKAQGPQLQENLTKRTQALVNELNNICLTYHTPMYIAQFGSLWKVKYHQEFPYSDLLFAAMRLRGIHILDGFPCFLTTAHTEEDIRQIVHAFEGSVHELVKAGFIPSAQGEDKNIPPVPHARLGKDANGNAAWFVHDDNNPGKYLQVVTS